MYSTKLWILLSGRFLLGVAMGVATVVAPLYSEESCDVAIRGRLGVAQNLQIDAGILLAYTLGAAGASLETQTLVPVAVPLVQLVALLWIPESPAHLAAAPEAEALRRAPKAARWLRLELDPLERRRREADARGGKETPPLRVRCRALLIVVGLMTLRQFLGINAFIYYTVDIFQQADSSLSPEMATLVVGIVQLVATALSGAVVERAGRRPLLLASGATAALSHAALALSASPWAAAATWLPLLAINVFFVAFAAGFGSLPWFITAEVVPTPDAAWMSGLAVASNWSLIFTVTKVFPESVAKLGRQMTFALLSVLSTVTTLFALLFVPETRGKPRDAIQRELLEESVFVLPCCARSRQRVKPTDRAGAGAGEQQPLADYGASVVPPRYS
ncbi:facilitated trehalose transporter Tret1-2 homolog [Schistocerca gregaria]|uniref:facilitated trehalose transporter Tret1-2 homolog n=1 Tax=Schistocerca gregaria TaxID=7010 RepID=UPI00211E50EE|nr:facilitated trehalose transporter Tret1-2 homolog [Schistocerca gregaria]